MSSGEQEVCEHGMPKSFGCDDCTIARLVAEVGALREKLEDAEENVALLGAVARGHMELLAERETDRAAMREALEALETCDPGDWSTGHVIHPSYDERSVDAAISLLKERIE